MRTRFKKPVQIRFESETTHADALQSRLDQIRGKLKGIAELDVRRFEHRGRNAALVYISGLQDERQIADHILKPLSAGLSDSWVVKTEPCAEHIAQELLAGQVAVLIDATDGIELLAPNRAPKRNITPATRERTIAGPNDGFSESLELNVSLLRTRMRTQDLKTERFQSGKASKTPTVLVYLEGIVDPDLVKRARELIESFPDDHLLDVTDFRCLVESHQGSLFPQTIDTERPDFVLQNLLAGKVGILAENSASCLLAPVTFFDLFFSPEDRYIRPSIASAIRALRFLALLITLFAVPVYVALVSYHYDMLPLRLLNQIAVTRGNIPFTPLTEALVLDVGIELLREAGIRLPQPLGQTLGVASALVIGQSILAAEIVSPVLVVAVGFTALASFAIPSYPAFLAFRLLRFAITLAAGFA